MYVVLTHMSGWLFRKSWWQGRPSYSGLKPTVCDAETIYRSRHTESNVETVRDHYQIRVNHNPAFRS